MSGWLLHNGILQRSLGDRYDRQYAIELSQMRLGGSIALVDHRLRAGSPTPGKTTALASLLAST